MRFFLLVLGFPQVQNIPKWQRIRVKRVTLMSWVLPPSTLQHQYVRTYASFGEILARWTFIFYKTLICGPMLSTQWRMTKIIRGRKNSTKWYKDQNSFETLML
jgi:hypothetical protein